MTDRAHVLRWGAAWALATAVLALCFRGIQWNAAAAAAARARPLWLALALLANVVIVILWASQWKLFLPRGCAVPFPRVLRITAVMAMTANSVPYLAGQATGLHLLATRGGVGHAAALSVAMLDQVVEGAAKVILLATVVLILPAPESLRAVLPVLVAAVGALAAVVLTGAARPEWLRRLFERASNARGPGRLQGALGFASRWAEGLDGGRRPSVLLAGVALALLMKLAEAAGMVAVQTGLGVELPFAATLVVLAAVSLATMLPLSPGNLGVYEGAALLAYRWAGVGVETALALALLQHVALLAAMGGAGWVAVTFRRAAARRPAAGPVRT